MSLSSDKNYPSFWSVNNSIAYTSAYTEIHGNPHLKPGPEYQASLNYTLKSKYVFTAFYNHEPDYFVQVLYQQPDKLVEVYKYYNLDYKKQIGLQTTIPFKVKEWLSSRLMVVGYYLREKDNDFGDIPYTRDTYSFIATMSNSFKLSNKPDITFILSGFYQNGSIQGIYDLSRSGNVDVALRWKSNNDKMQLTLKGTDLFETSQIKPSIHFKGQNVTNKFINPTRTFELALTCKFGNYQEKKREEVDTSRFK